MIIEQRIKNFERLGMGVFVHFGAYSVIGRGEWSKLSCQIPWEEYMKAVKSFNPDPCWAKELAATAKKAGARYITLTTRHHDGFSLYDTKGLNDYDAPHVCGRDLVAEFVEACRAEGIIPFFYHTLLDWHEEHYDADFPTYLQYLRNSVELLCTNYGKIGGIWFDGKWNKPNEDWEEDALYSMIRSHQPDAMIINNTGLHDRGALGHIELDSVTFERGRPQPLNMADSPKYIASEMCQVFGDHWGYAEMDLNFKSTAEIIRDLITCRRFGSNFLINVGPMGNGLLRPIEKASLEVLGQWVDVNGAILPAMPASITTNNEGSFVLQNGDTYYLVCDHLSMAGDINVALAGGATDNTVHFCPGKKIAAMTWLDDNTAVDFQQEEGNTVTLTPKPFGYGRNLVVRVAKFTLA